MRIVHVSTGDNRGAFSAAYRLHRNLVLRGHDSRMIVGQKSTSDPHVYAPSHASQIARRLFSTASGHLLRATCGKDERDRHFIVSNVGLTRIGPLLLKLRGFKPDLVIVHYIADFISVRQLKTIHRYFDAPLALYLVDMGLMTGGCHYAWACDDYKRACLSCRIPRVSPVRNRIAKVWRERQQFFSEAKPTVIAGSGWLYRQAKESALLGSLEIVKILIGLDTQLYQPADKDEWRDRLGLPRDKLILYFGAQNLEDPRKGFKSLMQAFEHLRNLLSDSERDNVCLFTVGDSDPSKTYAFPFEHVHKAFMSDPSAFAKTYAASDLFICPSIEDSGPMMINEAVASGTPVVAFEMGVAIDLVNNGETGFRVPLGNSRKLASALLHFIRLSQADRDRMSYACRNLGLRECSSLGQARAIEALIQGNVDKVERLTASTDRC